MDRSPFLLIFRLIIKTFDTHYEFIILVFSYKMCNAYKFNITMRLCIFIGVFFVSFSFCFGQKVTVSRDINIKGNFSYDILPNIGGNVIFYHDKSNEQSFEIFDSNFRYIQNISPEFERQGFMPIGIVPLDSTFNFYYKHMVYGKVHYKAISYNKNVAVVDSFTFAIMDKKDELGKPAFIFSQDKTKVLIFNPSEKGIYLRLINNQNFETYFEGMLTVPGINLRSDFRKIVLTNDGLLYLLTHKKTYWDKKESKHFQIIEVKKPNVFSLKSFYPNIDEITQILWSYDELNKKIVVAGLTSYNDETRITGYFGISMDYQQLDILNELSINKFSPDFVSDITGKKSKKVKGIADLRLIHIELRQDGGVLLFTEFVREYVRRSQVMTAGQFGAFPSSGYMDYYHEDVLVFATYPNGNEHWRRILFKKQYSQDDEGAYSSFFIFKTPSRIKLLYNDEIRNNNTVSEYVLDPIGDYERKSVLSTEYQNLRLRFIEAEQIGSKTIIVPSEKAWKINLVKIEYP